MRKETYRDGDKSVLVHSFLFFLNKKENILCDSDMCSLLSQDNSHFGTLFAHQLPLETSAIGVTPVRFTAIPLSDTPRPVLSNKTVVLTSL